MGVMPKPSTLNPNLELPVFWLLTQMGVMPKDAQFPGRTSRKSVPWSIEVTLENPFDFLKILLIFSKSF
jgi:hypothetical protein